MKPADVQADLRAGETPHGEARDADRPGRPRRPRHSPAGAPAGQASRPNRACCWSRPALLFVGVFVLFPLGFGVYISLTNWPLIGPYHFIGLANYDLAACTTRSSCSRSCSP